MPDQLSMTERATLPLYIKLSHISIVLLSVFFVLYIGKAILVPLLYAMVYAILLNPLVNYVCNKGVNRVLSIILVLAVAFTLVGVMIYWLSIQIGSFMDTLPVFKEKFAMVFRQGLGWMSETFNVKTAELKEGVEQMKDNGLGNIGRVIGAIGGVFVVVFLLPVYVFMILFYKPLLLDFISQLFAKEKYETVAEVLSQTKVLIQSYLVGLLVEAFVVAVMNVAVLLALGVQYAVLLGIVGALLNIIPYIGGLIAMGLALLVTLTTMEPIYVVYVFLAYSLVQFIDNNVIVPRIVASKVKINALVSIVVVLLGGALWGIAGMFLAIPLTAITKVILDRVEALKPFGFLLGDSMPPIGKNVFQFRKPREKAK